MKKLSDKGRAKDFSVTKLVKVNKGFRTSLTKRFVENCKMNEVDYVIQELVELENGQHGILITRRHTE